MFRNLPPFAPDDADLLSLGATMIETQAQADDPNLDNPDIPAGFTYLGQFIDHDITFDPNSKLQRDNDP
ncbi:MAG TPA: peroxidase, partial [Blastocatellia bacterium]|nr:peroxidase [Blastocatellia bacterium]